MIYKAVRAQIHNDGSVTEGKRRQLLMYPVKLRVGGLYFLGPGVPGQRNLYRILEEIPDRGEVEENG